LHLLLLLLLPLAAHAQNPVAIQQVDSYVVIHSDGNARITYSLTFKDLQGGRSEIKTLGPFTPSHKIVSSSGTTGGTSFPVTLDAIGQGKYHASLGLTTTRGQVYTVQVKYETTEPLMDHTKVEGKDYLAVFWSPPQWALPIELQKIDIITPFALPAGISKPEQVTQEVVQAAGLKTEKRAFGNFDRVVYYPTPDERSGKSYLSIRLEQKNLSPQADSVFKFYVPAAGLTVPTQKQIEDMRKHPQGEKAPARPIGYGAFSWWQIALFLIALVFVVSGVARLWSIGHKPPPMQKLYKAPEIELETFETPGVVPDLNAIEAAMYLGDSAKVSAGTRRCPCEAVVPLGRYCR
jgi:hypothetical protein